MENCQCSLGLPASSWLLWPGRQHAIQCYQSGLKVSPARPFTTLTLVCSVCCFFFPCIFSILVMVLFNLLSLKSPYFCIILINTCVFIICGLWFLILTHKAHHSGLRTVVFGSMLVVSWIFNFAFSFMVISAMSCLYSSENKSAWSLLCRSDPEVSHDLSKGLD